MSTNIIKALLRILAEACKGRNPQLQVRRWDNSAIEFQSWWYLTRRDDTITLVNYDRGIEERWELEQSYYSPEFGATLIDFISESFGVVIELDEEEEKEENTGFDYIELEEKEEKTGFDYIELEEEEEDTMKPKNRPAITRKKKK